MTLRLIAVGSFGAMLSPAALHLNKTDSPAKFVRVHDRGGMGPKHQQVRQNWQTHGAGLVSTFEDLVGDGDFDVAVACLGKNGTDYEVLKQLVPLMGKTGRNPILLHMSTVSPGFSQAADRFCTANGVRAFKSPLTGGVLGAQKATMLLLTCGPRAIYDALEPTLKCLGNPQYYGDDVTAGAKVKLIGHAMVGDGMLGIASAAALHAACFQKGELGGGQVAFFNTLNTGAGGTNQWERALKPAIEEQDFKKGFLIKHAVVDKIYLAELMAQEGQGLLSIVPILVLTLGYAFVLHHCDAGQDLATQAIVRVMLTDKKDQVNAFVRQHLDLTSTARAIKSCIKALPEGIRSTVMLNVNFDVE